MLEIKNCFYRVSVKALVLDGHREKFLITQKESGVWELPGGGLDWGTTPHEDLPREIAEEMGLEVTWMADHPSYFLSGQVGNHPDVWIANIVYETQLYSLEYTPTNECGAIAFVNADNIKDMNVFPLVRDLASIFTPANH